MFHSLHPSLSNYVALNPLKCIKQIQDDLFIQVFIDQIIQNGFQVLVGSSQPGQYVLGPLEVLLDPATVPPDRGGSFQIP